MLILGRAVIVGATSSSLNMKAATQGAGALPSSNINDLLYQVLTTDDDGNPAVRIIQVT
jgi:hypothetical protein